MNEARGSLTGRVALVTGSSRRIGRETARMLAWEGAHVVVHARASEAEITAVAADIRQEGGQASTALADITVEAEAQRLVGDILARHDRLDILVNNAALRAETPFAEIDLGAWRRINSVIVEGAFLVTRAAIPSMVRHRYGRIVSIGGVSGHAGVFDRVHVATAKSALVGFTKALAVEFSDSGVTANLVVPGRIGGPRSAGAGQGGRFPSDVGPLVPIEGKPHRVAELVRFLASPSGDFMTGQVVHVSGGMYLP